MSRLTILMILGAFVALSPYLGMPLSTLGIILPFVGLVIAAIALTVKLRLNAAAPEVVRAPVAAEPVLSYDVQEA